MKHYLWIDLETTGFDPERCGIIEVAAILTTDRMNVIEVYESLVDAGSHHWEDGAIKMHQKNGLIARRFTSASKHIGTIERDILRMLDERGVKRPMLAGSSVHFDRTFIHNDMQGLDEALHYRHLDVSAIAEMMRGLGYELPELPPPNHTALSDIHGSIKLFRHWRGVVGWAPPVRCSTERG